MTVKTFKFVEGNTKEGLKFTAKNRISGLAIDLTDATATLRVKNNSTDTLIFESVLTIDPDQVTNTGVFYYYPISADMDSDAIGKLVSEVTIIFPDLTEVRIQEPKINIVPKFPTS